MRSEEVEVFKALAGALLLSGLLYLVAVATGSP